MSRKNDLANLFAKKLPTGNSPSSAAGPQTATGAQNPGSNPERVRSAAIGAMSASLQSLARNAAEVQEKLQTGEVVIELPPDLLDTSFVPDRLVGSDPSFEDLKESIRVSGQQVPILVRPSPDRSGRYQIAYGHRRARAAREVGLQVKAVVRKLSDDELVIAQGKENLERRDLSFIERAIFAARLEARGFGRATIIAALGSEKGNVSRYISLAQQIPDALVVAIGPAPSIGRPRWQAFGKLLVQPGALERAQGLCAAPEFLAADTDARFEFLFEALSAPINRHTNAAQWTPPGATASIDIMRTGKALRLSIPQRLMSDFGEFIVAELPSLYERFQSTQSKEESEVVSS